MQLSYVNRMLGASKFEFQSQFGSMGFQRTSSAGDPATALSNSYMDINAGLNYSHREKDWGFGIGAASFMQAALKPACTSPVPIRFRNVSRSTVRYILKQADAMSFISVV